MNGPADELRHAQELFKAGKADLAVAACRRVFASATGNLATTAGTMLATLLGLQGSHADAAEILRKVAPASPRDPQVWNNFGVALEKTGNIPDAIDAYRRSIAIRPAADSPVNLGNAQEAAGRIVSAESTLREAIGRDPSNKRALQGLAAALAAMGRADEAIAAYEDLAARHPGDPLAGSKLLFALRHIDGVSPSALFQRHLDWARQHAPSHIPRRPPMPPLDGRRLRIGYLSPDFREHPGARFIQPLLEHHDRSRFKIFCYSDVAVPDMMTSALRPLADVWRDTAALSNADVARLIRCDRIDVLIDRTSHMNGARILLSTLRPAPLFGTYQGYPGTSGLPSVDFHLTDENLDPPGMTNAQYTEKLIRLPRCCRAYVPGDLPPIRDAQNRGSTNQNGPTFAVVNRLFKVTDRMVRLWSRILAAVHGSRLMLLAGNVNEYFPMLRERLGRLGIPADRVELLGAMPRGKYLQWFGQADLALDTFPYGGMTTTCDGLWMGVPTITLAGDTNASRSGASLLTAAGLARLVAQTEEEYVALAISAVADRNRLAQLHANLRSDVSASQLGDGAGLARAVENAIEQLARSMG